MYFILSKTLGLLADPGWQILLLLMLAGLAIWRGMRRLSKICLFMALGWFLVISLTPLGGWLVHTLERQSQTLVPCIGMRADFSGPPKRSEWTDVQVTCLPKTVDGIIVLGGATDQNLTAIYAQPQTNEAAERLAEFAYLGRLYPMAKMIFSGGSGRLRAELLREDQVAQDWLVRQAFPIERVMFEGSSRNTRENALHSTQLAQIAPDEVWLLITSARHMPRARALFAAEGLFVTPYPVDYTTEPDWPLQWFPGPTRGFSMVSLGLREWVGLFVAFLSGQISRNHLQTAAS